MKTIFVLFLIFYNSQNSMTSQQVGFTDMNSCKIALESFMKVWNNGSRSDGHVGYVSGECMEVKQ